MCNILAFLFFKTDYPTQKVQSKIKDFPFPKFVLLKSAVKSMHFQAKRAKQELKHF